MVAEIAERDRIVIIDTNTERGREIANSFESTGGCLITRIFQQAGEVKYYPPLKEGASIGPCLITMWHISDFLQQEKWPEVESTCEVFYGGGGGDALDTPNTSREVIQRPINEESGVLRTDEVLDLLTYVKEKYAWGNKDAIRPSFLRRDDQTSFLAALCILCQGYLAVHATRDEDGWGPAEIRSALHVMNWPSVAEEGTRLFTANLENKQQLVESSDWWSGIFGMEKVELQKRVSEEFKARQGEAPTAVSILLDSICATTPTQIQPQVVADAFCVISKRLEGTTCEQA
jgi:hypothetical protein